VKSSDEEKTTTYSHLLNFYAEMPIVAVRNEFYIYDTLSLLADIGGMAGILFGLSLVSSYDTLSGTLVKLF
jgi:hypothetical protein